MDLQFNVESEPRDTLTAAVNGRVSQRQSYFVWSWWMPEYASTAATKTVGQYMFEQADHSATLTA